MVLLKSETLKDWFKRIVLYLSLFILIMWSAPILLGAIKTNPDNSRYMISALIQSEAAIVAIVITVTIIAVQQTSSLYSPRLLNIFIYRNPDFWLLFFIYIGSMVYGLRVLFQIDEIYNPIFEEPLFLNISNIYSPIIWTYYFGIFAFVSLILYIDHTINLLKPVNIIKILSEDLTKENLLNKNDTILPILDIMSASLDKHHDTTTLEGLETIEDKIKQFIQMLGPDNFKPIGKFEQLKTLIDDEINKRNIDSSPEGQQRGLIPPLTDKIVLDLSSYKSFLHNGELDESEKFEKFKKIIYMKDFIKLDSCNDIKNIMDEVQNEYSVINKIFLPFNSIGQLAANNLNSDVLNKVVDLLKKIGIVAIEQEVEYISKCAITSLEMIGLIVVTNKRTEDIALNVASSLNEFRYQCYNKDMAHYIFPLVNKSINKILTKAKNHGSEGLSTDILYAGTFDDVQEMANDT